MANPDDQFACPGCGKALRNRDLLLTTMEQCRACKCVIKTSEHWSSRNDERILQEDVFAIDTWLSQVADLKVSRILTTNRRENMFGLSMGFHFLDDARYVTTSQHQDSR